MKKNIFIILLIILLSIPAVFALFQPGFFQSDDGEWMIIRFSAFYQALRDGQFPVRFLTRLNYGYGYPVANFLYPGFMYLGVPIHVIGFGFVDTIKIILGGSLITSGIFTYLWLSKLFNKWPSIVGSLIYIYLPYHLYDLYTRGSVGEMLALAVVPFVLWQTERRSLFWAAIGIGFLMLSHNTLALLFLILLVLYALLDIYVSKNKRNIFWWYFTVFSLGFGVSCFFWFPAIHDLQYTIFSQTPVAEWSSYFADIRLIGLSSLVIFILTFILFIFKRIKLLNHRLTFFFFIIGCGSIFFASSGSSFLWNVLPVSIIQFPFRFLSITVIAASFLAAVIISTVPKKYTLSMGMLLLFLTSISSLQYVKPDAYFNKGEDFYATNEGTTTVKNEYMPKWVSVPPLSHPESMIETSNATVSNIMVKSNKIEFTVLPENEAEIRVHRIYFPGWEIKKDGLAYPGYYEEILKNGIFNFTWKSGAKQSSQYEIFFTETNQRIVSDLVSLISFFALIIFSRRKKII